MAAISPMRAGSQRYGSIPEQWTALGSYQPGLRKERFLAMARLLSILVLSALCLPPGRASADTLKPHESVVSEMGSRQRCACTWRRQARIVHYKRYRSVRAHYSDYSFGLDPLPYRFGYFPEPYRYRYHAAMVTIRPYRYYR